MPATPNTSEPRLVRVAGRDTWHIYHCRRRISTGSTDRPEAARVLAAYVRSLAAPAQPGAVTVAAVLASYLADRKERARPGAERLEWAHKPLVRHLGAMLPETLTDAACRAYARTRRAEGVASSTARTELQALRAALRWAADPRRRMIAEAVPVELPPRPPARERWLTRDEAAALLEGCTGKHVRLFVTLALHTAARRGAILALTWDRVDLDRRVIDFREPGREQTRKRRVAVPINDTLTAALLEAKERTAAAEVISWAGGRVDSIKHGFRSACDRAGLHGVTPHTLRHTAVTWMMQAGVDVWQVAGFAGMSVEVLTAVYGHHHPNHMRQAAAALG